jgi:alpha-galactosidase
MGFKQLKDVNFKGWSTWDYYAYRFSPDDIYENAKKIKKLAPTANLIQIDAGWYSQRGDFGQTRADFPGGMEAMARKIEDEGMILGVWIDGFRANTDSEVFKNHPEYFLHDQDGKPIVRLMRPEEARQYKGLFRLLSPWCPCPYGRVHPCDPRRNGNHLL